ncbi:MAG TPA: hypothetical protein VF159_01280, partial [Gemmatimonadaceae bacterium]
IVLTIVHTWPLAAAPGYWSRNNSGDAVLNEWAVAWVGHALGTRPLRLYDANIFHPERRTLAYSEHLVVQGAIVAPVVWLGGSAVLAYNLAMMAGFILTGWAFCLLVHRWTGFWSAGVIAGSGAAFNSHVLMRLPHLQTQHLEFFALALYALDRILVDRRWRSAVLLGAAHALQGLAGIYVFVFTSWGLAFAALTRVREWLGRGRLRAFALVTIGVLFAAALLAPSLYQYALVSREMGFTRTMDDARRYAATWTDYLLSGSRLHWELWSRRFAGSMAANFPGVTVTVLAVLTLATGIAWRDRRARMAAGVVIGCALLSMGPSIPGYELLFRIVPLLRAVRVIAHFGQIVLLGMAILAGFGVAWLAIRYRTRRCWPAVVVLLTVVVNAEALRAPFPYTPFEGIPSIYDFLARERHAIVAELPLYPRHMFFGNANYMLASTRHWHPILNGYSGFIPPSYQRVYDELKGFPDERSLAALRGLGVSHVVVHRDEFVYFQGAAQYDAIRQTRDLVPFATSEKIQMYRLKPR